MSTQPNGPPPDHTVAYPSPPPAPAATLTHGEAVTPPPPAAGTRSWAAGAFGGQFAAAAGDRAVGPYEVMEEIGKGGMGVVYRARHVALNRVVALKTILAGPGVSPAMMDRFRIEAEAVARLKHPGIVQVYDVGEQDGRPYMAMEMIDGGTLAQKADGKPQNPRAAAQTVESIARAVAVAHDANIVHRDLKPGNVLLTRDGQPKVTDFGLAKDLDRLGSHTRTGSILGTPSYMAPEQAAGRINDIGPGTDVYALGAILYELLTGRPPFRGESPIDTIRQVLDGEVVSPKRLVPKLARDLDTICLKALNKPVHRRYASAADMADDLRRFLDGEPITARPVGDGERAWKWVRRHPTTSALVAAGVAALAGFIALGVWSHAAVTARAKEAEVAKQAAEDALAEGTRRMVRLNVANGTRQLDDGNFPGSVLWFAEALRLEHDGGERADVHRTRLAAVLDRCPRLSQVWLHEAAVTDAHFDAAGARVFTAGDDGLARVWDAATGQPVGPPLEHGGPIKVSAFALDGSAAATVGADGTLKFWDVATGRAVAAGANGTAVTRAVFHPDGKRLLTGGTAGRARLWDAATGQLAAPPAEFADALSCVCFSPDGTRYAAACAEGTVRVFDAATGQPVGPPLKHGSPVLWCSFHPAGAKLATGAADGAGRVWEPATGQQLLPAPVRHADAVTVIRFSPDGTRLVTASADRTGQVWDAATGLPVGRPAQHHSGVLIAQFSPDGRWYLTAGDDNTTRVWDSKTGDPVSPPFHDNATPAAARFSPNGHQLLVATPNRLAKLWDLIPPPGPAAPPPAAPPPAPAAPHRDGPLALPSPDGRLVVTFGGGQPVRVRRAADYEPVTPALGSGAAVTAAGFSPDGGRVAVGDAEGNVTVCGAASGRPLWEKPARHAAQVVRVLFSDDGKTVASTSDDNTAGLWDAATGRAVAPPIRLAATVYDVAFGPGGKTLFTRFPDGLAKVWDAATGEPLTPPFPAADDWRARLAPDPRPADDLLALGQVLAGQHLTPSGGLAPTDPAAVRAAWAKLKETYPAQFTADRPAVLGWYRRQAAAAEAAGQWFAAAWHLDKLIAADPDGGGDLRQRRARAAAQLGDWARAAAAADAAIHRQPADPDPWYFRGMARGQLGEWDRAAADFAKAVELRADPDAAVGLAARVRLDAGDRAGYRTATKELAEFYAHADPAPRVARQAAWACALAPESGADPAAVLKLAEAGGTDPAGLTTLALALVRAGRPEDAAGKLRDVCPAAPDRPAAWLVYALALTKLGKPGEAAPWRDKAAAWLKAGREPGTPPPSWDARFDAETLLAEVGK